MAAKNNQHKFRFAITGAASTAIDFGILFILHAFGIQSIVANFISTGTAFCFSFTANRHFTFKAHSGNIRRQFILFFVTTFFGIWVIQPIIIWLIEPMIQPFGYADWVNLFVAKLVATCVTLVWNYVMYSRFVFPEAQRE